MATVRFQELGPGCAEIGGPSIGSWGQCTMHLCTAETTGVTVYHPTEVNETVSLGDTVEVFTHQSTAQNLHEKFQNLGWGYSGPKFLSPP